MSELWKLVKDTCTIGVGVAESGWMFYACAAATTITALWLTYVLAFAIIAWQQEQSSFKKVSFLVPATFSTVWVMLSYYHMLSLLPSLLFGDVQETRQKIHLCGHHVAIVTLKILGWEIEVQGRDLIPNTTVVFVANHQSMADILVMHFALPNSLFSWVSKSSVFMAPGIGWFMSGAGYVPLKRRDKGSIMQMFKHCRRTLQEKWSVVMFPAGTRKRHKVVPFKLGAFSLASEANVPIVPVSIFLPPNLWISSAGPKKLRVVFHEALAVKPPTPSQENGAANPEPDTKDKALTLEEASAESFRLIVSGLGPDYYDPAPVQGS